MVRLMPIPLFHHPQLFLTLRGNQRINLEEQCVAWNVINVATFQQNERAERKVYVFKIVWKKKILAYKC